jgi:nucleoside diphosphate kinase
MDERTVSSPFTLALIKPHVATKLPFGTFMHPYDVNDYTRVDIYSAQFEILNKLEELRFKIICVNNIIFTDEIIEEFYQDHVGKPYWDSLAKSMQADQVTALLLYKPDGAIMALRNILGDTDSRKAEPNTLRALYGEKSDIVANNGLHASDSYLSFEREFKILFGREGT